MYFSMIRLRRDLSAREVASLGRQDGYGKHRQVWEIFSDSSERRRDFLYRYEKMGELPGYYTVSERAPVDDRGFWEIRTKAYNPKFGRGDRLSFSVCVNPIRSTRDETGRQHRHDVVMDLKTRIGFKNLPEEKRPQVGTLIQEAGMEWLTPRESEYGFTIDESCLRADGYQQHKLLKGKSATPVNFSSLELNGILTVEDPKRFIERCLFEGVGPAKGFGCGLMLVRRL
jgi:CRISPR system Cascade subunit CasE